MKRPHGAGRLYVKWGSYYGRWRMPDGRYLNRRIGAVRQHGSSEGLTKSQAEAALRRLVEQESRRRPPAVAERVRSVDEVIDIVRDRLVIQGARKSYQENCESMQRIHSRRRSARVGSTTSPVTMSSAWADRCSDAGSRRRRCATS